MTRSDRESREAPPWGVFVLVLLALLYLALDSARCSTGNGCGDVGISDEGARGLAG